jgi:hypothetical protein
MVSAAKAFDKEPPRQPLTNLKAIKEDFQWRYVDRKKTDQVIKFCGESTTLDQAVERAVRARDAEGKHHNHQSKVDLTARIEFGRRIFHGKKDWLGRIHAAKEDGLEWLTPFDAMHDWFDAIKPYGIGPVTVYDVAVRIGAFLEIEPEQVYMHAGVRQGMKALGQALGNHPAGKRLAGAHKLQRVPKYLLPKPLRSMKADDVEDILCTYREVFLTW